MAWYYKYISSALGWAVCVFILPLTITELIIDERAEATQYCSEKKYNPPFVQTEENKKRLLENRACVFRSDDIARVGVQQRI